MDVRETIEAWKVLWSLGKEKKADKSLLTLMETTIAYLTSYQTLQEMEKWERE